MLPPAIAAAVFTTIAIVPPGGAPARGLRVEQVEGPVDASHPLLVRAAIEDALSSQWEVPIETEFRVPGATSVRVARMRVVPYAFARVALAAWVITFVALLQWAARRIPFRRKWAG